VRAAGAAVPDSTACSSGTNTLVDPADGLIVPKQAIKSTVA